MDFDEDSNISGIEDTILNVDDSIFKCSHCDRPENDFIFKLTVLGPRTYCKNGCSFICPNCLNLSQKIFCHKGFFFPTSCIHCNFKFVPDFKSNDDLITASGKFYDERMESMKECQTLFTKRKKDLIDCKILILLKWNLNDGESFGILPLEIIENIFQKMSVRF